MLVYAPLTKSQEDFYKSAVDRTIQSLLENKNDQLDLIFEESSSSSSKKGGGKVSAGKEAKEVVPADENQASEEAEPLSRAGRRGRRDINYAFFDSGERTAKKMNLMKDEKKRRKVYADESSDEEGEGKDDNEEEREADEDW